MPRTLDHAVALTGLGLTSPFGVGVATDILSHPAATVPRQDDGAWRLLKETLAPNAKRVAELGGDRAALLARPAIEAALRQARLDLTATDPTRVGLVLGSVYAALADMLQFATEVKDQTPRFVSPLHFPHTVGNYAAGALARTLKINGPNVTLGGGPQAGLAAVAEAVRLLQDHRADLILAGGTDAISPSLLPAMIDAQQALPDGPFASQPAEGACFVCLEPESRARARNATILARIDLPDDPPPAGLVSAHFTGRSVHDHDELNALRELARPAGQPCVLSARHLLANAFAATAAAQLALAVTALCHRSAPLWQRDQTETTEPLVTQQPLPADLAAALVVSAPDNRHRRTILYLEPPTS